MIEEIEDVTVLVQREDLIADQGHVLHQKGIVILLAALLSYEITFFQLKNIFLISIYVLCSKRVSGFDMAPPASAMLAAGAPVTGQVPPPPPTLPGAGMYPNMFPAQVCAFYPFKNIN